MLGFGQLGHILEVLRSYRSLSHGVLLDIVVKERVLIEGWRLFSVRRRVKGHVHLPLGVAVFLHLLDPLGVGARLLSWRAVEALQGITSDNRRVLQANI